MVRYLRGGVAPSPCVYSWNDLAKISDKAAERPDDFLEWVGFTTRVPATGIKQISTYLFHLRICDVQEGNGFVFEFLDGPLMAMNSDGQTTGGWPDCEIRTYLNDEFLLTLPEDLQAVLKKVDVVCDLNPDANSEELTTVKDKLWLPSLSQIKAQKQNEGNQFKYYQMYGNQYNAGARKSAMYGHSNGYGVETDWWLRTINDNSLGKTMWASVNIAFAINYANPDSHCLVCPCFCITVAA